DVELAVLGGRAVRIHAQHQIARNHGERRCQLRAVFYVARCELCRGQLQARGVDSPAGAVEMHVQRSMCQRSVARTARPHGVTRIRLDEWRPQCILNRAWVIKPRVAVEPFPTIEYAAPHTTKFSSSVPPGANVPSG